MAPSYNQLQNEIKQAQLEDHKTLTKLLEKHRNTPNEKAQEKIADQIRTIIQEHRENPFPEPPVRTYTSQKSLYIGDSIHKQRPYSIPESQLTRHTLVSAATGAGKTNLITQMLLQTDLPFLAFDLKQDYRHLLEKDASIKVIPKNKVKFNPLKPPPGLTEHEWKNRVVQIICDTTHLLDASQNYIDENLAPIYQSGLNTAYTHQSTPTLHDLKDRVENQTENDYGKRSNYQQTVLNRLSKLTSGESGEIFDTEDGLDIEHLLNQRVVLEIHNLDEYAQNLLMEVLIEWIYQYRIKHNHRGEKVEHLIIADECKQIFDRKKEQNTAKGIPRIDHIVSRIRAYTEGIIAADQEPLKLTDTIKANTNTKILLPNVDHKQLEDISQSMGLKKLQRRKAENLETGQAIVKSMHRGPFHIQVNHVDLDTNVTDTDVENRFDPVEVYKNPDVDGNGTTRTTKEKSGAGLEKINESSNDLIELSSKEKMLLQSLHREPFKKLTDHHYSKFSSTSKAVKTKNTLIQKGLVEEKKVNTGAGERTLFEVTGRGREHLEQPDNKQRKGRGGVVHRYWQHHIKQKLEDHGWKTAIEELDADIYAKNPDNGDETAVEIARSTKMREVEHVKKHLDNGFDHVTVCASSEDDVDTIQRRLEENGLNTDSVDVRAVHQYYQEELQH